MDWPKPKKISQRCHKYSKNVLKWLLPLPSISIHACTPLKKAILDVFLNFGNPRKISKRCHKDFKIVRKWLRAAPTL